MQGNIRLNVAWYTEPPETLVAIKKRAKRLVGLISGYLDGDGLPECDVKQYPCGFYAEHEGGVWAKPELEELDREIAELAFEVHELASTAKFADENLKEAKAALHAALLEREKEAGAYRAGPFKVTRVVKNGRRSYDYAAMKDAGYPVEDYMTIGKPSDYVTVEELNDGGE